VSANTLCIEFYAHKQVPLRAIASGVTPLYGELNPYDGGDTTRFSLLTRIAQSDDAGSWKANFYAIK
jgi:hypothetical protein